MANPSDYPIFNHWYTTINWLLERCDRMPKHVRFTVSGRIVNLAMDTTELILEAIYTRRSVPSAILHTYLFCKDQIILPHTA